MSQQISTTAADELQSWVLTDRKSPVSRGWGRKMSLLLPAINLPRKQRLYMLSWITIMMIKKPRPQLRTRGKSVLMNQHFVDP